MILSDATYSTSLDPKIDRFGLQVHTLFAVLADKRIISGFQYRRYNKLDISIRLKYNLKNQ